jgi:hypothetical protein
MIMADIFKILIPLLGTLMSFVCYCLLFEGTFPRAVERCKQTYLEKPIKSIILGVMLGVPATTIGIAILSSGTPIGQFVGLSMLFLLASLAILGAAGLSGLIGERLNSPQDAHQPWKRVYRGSIVLAITFVFPMVGWFLVFPLTFLSGFGAALLAYKGRKKVAPPIMADPALGATQS